MCITCAGGVATAFQAATLMGAPVAYAAYRRARAALGLRDTSVAAVEAQTAAALGSAPSLETRSIASTASGENWAPAQRRISISASALVSGT